MHIKDNFCFIYAKTETGKGYVTSLKLTEKGQYDLRNTPLMKPLSMQNPTGRHML